MSRISQSIVEYFSEHEKYKCGYCKSPDTNFSHGMWAHTLNVQDYQDLIDRGWRRSGKYCYKPTMDQTCCPMYTIKCEALDFKISKSQKKILKKMSKMLRGELKKNDIADFDESINEESDLNTTEISNCLKQVEKAQKNATKINLSLVTDSLDMRILSSQNSTRRENMMESSSAGGSVKHERNLTPSFSGKDYKAGIGFDQSKPPPKKAKFMRLERKQNKLLSLGKSSIEVDSILKNSKQSTAGKNLEELFSEENVEQHKLELRLVRTSPMSSEYCNTSRESYELYKKYQMMIHKESPEKLTEEQYAKFLVKSPLKEWSPAEGPPQGYGSFHQQYWLDDKLIAVGVIDILPSCVSSVYFFYDPIYSYLSLGTYGSLREVMLTRQLSKVASSLKYYYMGFYIHSCPKMRYKAKMRPSKLLCPETYAWCDIEDSIPKLEKEKYSRLNTDIDAIDENISNDISQVQVFYKHRCVPYYIYKNQSHGAEDEDEVREYANLVGMRCAHSLLLYRN